MYTHPVRPACAMALLAADRRVEQHDRTCRVIIPDVVMHLLKVPDVFAGLGVQRNDRGAEQIVARARRAVIVGTAITDREVNEPQLRVEGRRVPDRRPAVRVLIAARRPSIGTHLSRPR
jgi:hypothetical protein